MKVFLYRLCQCTWGILQTLLGFIVFCFNIKEEHFSYHGAVITKWKLQSSVSLGLFVFVAKEERCYPEQGITSKDEAAKRLLVHEYGHTIQSLLSGPLYLIVFGLPSMLWGFLPNCHEKRKTKGISYFDFFTESGANRLGERVTGEKSMERIMID